MNKQWEMTATHYWTHTAFSSMSLPAISSPHTLNCILYRIFGLKTILCHCTNGCFYFGKEVSWENWKNTKNRCNVSLYTSSDGRKSNINIFAPNHREGSTMICNVACLQVGEGFESRVGDVLGGVCMFSMCLYGFSMGFFPESIHMHIVWDGALLYLSLGVVCALRKVFSFTHHWLLSIRTAWPMLPGHLWPVKHAKTSLQYGRFSFVPVVSHTFPLRSSEKYPPTCIFQH